MCIGCDKRLTIEHILLTCSDFIEIRESHFTTKSEKIFNFLKEINIFGKNLNLRSFLVMFMFSPFKHGFKIVYRPILRHTFLKIKYAIWDVYHPDITAPVDWV